MPEVTLLTHDLWSAAARESAQSIYTVAAVAYVTNVDDFHFKASDILVIDASEEAIRTGKTSALIVENLLTRGVLLYSCPNLHAKVYVFEDSVIVGSSNLSSSSRSLLIECATLTRDTTLIAETRKWIQHLASRSERIDQDFVDRAKAIVVERLESEVLNQSATGELWYLAVPPNALSKNMRAYFIALVIAQLGTLEAERPFRLWPNADFRQHEKQGRLRRSGSNFVLSSSGVEYFSQPKQRPRDDLLQIFLAAVRTGNGSALPKGIEAGLLTLPEA